MLLVVVVSGVGCATRGFASGRVEVSSRLFCTPFEEDMVGLIERDAECFGWILRTKSCGQAI